PVALIVMGSTLGLSTLAFLIIGLAWRVPPDWLPPAWVLGALLTLGVGWLLSRRRTPTKPETQATSGWRAIESNDPWTRSRSFLRRMRDGVRATGALHHRRPGGRRPP